VGWLQIVDTLPRMAREQGGIIATADWLPIGQSYVMPARDNLSDRWYRNGEERQRCLAELPMNLTSLLFKTNASVA
jgi:hypothetical protein